MHYIGINKARSQAEKYLVFTSSHCAASATVWRIVVKIGDVTPIIPNWATGTRQTFMYGLGRDGNPKPQLSLF